MLVHLAAGTSQVVTIALSAISVTGNIFISQELDNISLTNNKIFCILSFSAVLVGHHDTAGVKFIQ